MENLYAIFLGAVQGITEFLPISSSAHLILAEKFINLQSQTLTFDISVHFGSLIAVIIYFRKEFKNLVIGFFDLCLQKNSSNSALFIKIIIATIPICIIGLIFKDFIENNIRDSLIIIAITSIAWGILLYLADKKEETITSINNITYKTAFLMGIAQAFAIIPGTSRSGSTMTIARFLKFSRSVSAEFSMLMSIPVISLIMLASIGDIIKHSNNAIIDYKFLLIGSISSFIFAILSIHLLIKLINKIGFTPFVIYRIILGIAIIYIII